MYPLRNIVVAACIVSQPVQGQGAADSSTIGSVVARDAGIDIQQLLTDSSGALFISDDRATWVGRVYAAIRERYPRTGQPVYDSTYRATARIDAPVFRGDSAFVRVQWSQCRRTGLMTFGATTETWTFWRSPDGAWARVHPRNAVSEIAEGQCGVRR